jgi:ribonuclease HII
MRTWPTLEWEQRLWAQGYCRLAGLDEAGRGAWAGAVVAAAVILPPDDGIAQRLAGVGDSKQLTPAQRERLYDVIVREAVAVGVGAVPAEVIDALGIVAATRQVMALAVAHLAVPPEHLLIDALRLPDVACPQTSLIKGDACCLSIAAASIVAKVTRDRLLVELDQQYPGYGLARHKGYGTPQHRAALAHLGPCLLHRRSYRPIRELLTHVCEYPALHR